MSSAATSYVLLTVGQLVFDEAQRNGLARDNFKVCRDGETACGVLDGLTSTLSRS